jgi:hypothetical protein
MDLGITNVTRRVVPIMVVTAEEVATAEAPPPDEVSVTVTFDGLIVPEGKFVPVTLITFTPANPDVGAVDGLRVTCVWASADRAPPISTPTRLTIDAASDNLRFIIRSPKATRNLAFADTPIRTGPASHSLADFKHGPSSLPFRFGTCSTRCQSDETFYGLAITLSFASAIQQFSAMKAKGKHLRLERKSLARE